jgi:hypothetical protein
VDYTSGQHDAPDEPVLQLRRRALTIVFKAQDGTTLKQAWELYKLYCDEARTSPFRLTKIKFREELKNYFDEFHDRGRGRRRSGSEASIR